MIAWLVLFQLAGNSTLGYVSSRSLMHWMFRAYHPIPSEADKQAEHPQEATDAHGLYVPLVVLALMWWKRKELMAAELKTWWPGLVLVAAGLFFHLVGYAVQQPRISVVGLFTGIYGLMGLAWGPGWLSRSFFPYFLFIFSVPLGSLAEPITFKLRLLVSQLTEVISHNILSIDIIRQGNLLIDPSGHYQYEVAAACSGIRSLFVTVGMALVLGFLSFRQWWKRLVMLASAFPLAVLGNLVRMLTIIIASDLGGRGWGTYIHDGGPGGILSLLPYVPAFLGLFVLEHYLGRGLPTDADRGEKTRAELTSTNASSAVIPQPLEAKR